MATIATAVSYGWGGVLAARHMLDLGTVVAFVALLGRMYFPLMGLSNVQVSVMTTLVSFERIFEVLDLKPMITEKPAAVAVPPGPLSVRFERVSFRYPTAAEVSLASLESIAVPSAKWRRAPCCRTSSSRRSGQLVALVGPSGAGKSTLTMLIPRLYDVQARGAAERRGRSGRDAGICTAAHRRWSRRRRISFTTLCAQLIYARPMLRMRTSETRYALRRSWRLSRRFRTASTPWSASAATVSRR
jgi:ATP-binding cassette subfamily B protein